VRQQGLPPISVTPTDGIAADVRRGSWALARSLESEPMGRYSTIWLARTTPRRTLVLLRKSTQKHAEVAQHNIRAGVQDVVGRVDGAGDSSRRPKGVAR